MQMTTRGATILSAAIVIAAAAGSWRPAAAQAARSDDVLPALLTEVRGLRAAIEQMAGAGPRVQLLSSRLQIQEGRIAGMIRRLDTVRDTLAGARRELEQFSGALKMMEGGEEPQEPGAHKEDFGPLLAGMKKQVAAAQANVDRLVAEEAQLTQDVTMEQARWTEISQRLDELERSLAKR
jgi:hypothetical protein